jgi:hypothetical protein
MQQQSPRDGDTYGVHSTFLGLESSADGVVGLMLASLTFIQRGYRHLIISIFSDSANDLGAPTI